MPSIPGEVANRLTCCSQVFIYLIITLGVGAVMPHHLEAQCGPEVTINEGFETVDPPCGPVPVGGLINGSFNMGCMTGWSAAWGTPSVCSVNPNSGNYFACLGSNNEAIFQQVTLCIGSPHTLDFHYRGLVGFNGSLQVYLANGLSNQPMSNNGNPPLVIQPSWQLLGIYPITNNIWTQAVVDFIPFNPANNQLVFIDVPTGTLDVGIDDVMLSNNNHGEAVIDAEIICGSQSDSIFTFQVNILDAPPGFNGTQFFWTFGDGQTGTGSPVFHIYSEPGAYEVCVEVRDSCFCSQQICTTILYDSCTCNCMPDDSPPEIINLPAALVEVACIADVPEVPDLEIEDLCEDEPVILFSENSTGSDCNKTITRTWQISDDCGNSTQFVQTIFVQDNIPPQIIVPPTDPVVSCQNADVLFELWLEAHGNTVFVENCGNVVWTASYLGPPSSGCESIPVAFTATDGCNNSTLVNAVFTVSDMVAPLITQQASNLIGVCEPLENIQIENWLSDAGGAAAIDACGEVTWSHNYPGTISSDSVQVIFQVTDDCLNVAFDTAWILHVHESDTVFEASSTCDPQYAGIDTVIMQSGSCELWTITETALLPSQIFEQTMIICQEAPRPDDTLFMLNPFGCEDLFVTHFSNQWIPPTSIDIFSCDTAQAGIDTLIFPGQICDSVVYVTTTYTPPEMNNATILVCDPNLAGMDTLIIPGPVCDTILFLTSIYSPPDLMQEFNTVCDSTLAGSDTLFFQNLFGCDSLVISTSVYEALPIRFEETDLCGDGIDFVDTQWIAGFPCDTMMVESFHFLGTDHVFLQNYVCDSSLAGSVEDIFTGSDGCDSLVTTTFLYAGIDTLFQQQLTCDPDEEGIQVSVSPGIYCDTVRVTDWILSPFVQRIDSIWACSILIEQTDTTFLQSVDGCDSLVILHLFPDSITFTSLVTDETCSGFEDGLIEIFPLVEGTPPYRFSLLSGVQQPDPLFSNLAPGQYSMVIEDAAGCTDTLSDVTVGAGQAFTIGIEVTGNLVPGQWIDLAVTGNLSLASWLWSATDPLSCITCPSPQLGPMSMDQLINVEVISVEGCPGAATYDLVLRKPASYYIPNIFSPNQDGINDVFTIFSTVPGIIVRSMEIYSRWGEILFHQQDFSPGDPKGMWNGTFLEKPMNPGVFVYVIRLLDENGNEQRLSGDVMLIR